MTTKSRAAVGGKRCQQVTGTNGGSWDTPDWVHTTPLPVTCGQPASVVATRMVGGLRVSCAYCVDHAAVARG
tara:strand:- start:92 stop:307 length:216 start_codon:yes stop_codon:yes gene_type:complete